MAGAIGTGDKKSVNVELNIVPFIDLMSCLTAFLLVTAVWVDIAQINIQPKGKARDLPQVQVDEEPPTLCVLVQSDQIWVGVSRSQETFEPIKKVGNEQNWDQFERLLKEIKDSKGKDYDFAARNDLELAAESTPQAQVKYQDIIHAMDIAVKVKFYDVGLTDPQGLAVRPTH